MTIHSAGDWGEGARSRALRHLLLTSASMLLIAGTAIAANADSASESGGSAEAQDAAGEHDEIVVTAPLFRDVRPERDMDEDAIASYGVSTVDELVAEILAELQGDEEPIFIINGERINDLDEIGAYPVEVLRQLQVFPRGEGVRAGGRPGQRIVSMTLHRQMRSATALFAPRVATEGDWHGWRGETLFTYLRGQTRANVALRVRDEGSLLESERGIIQPLAQVPFAAAGNIIAYPDLSGEIDPILTEAAGTVVTIVPVPANPDPTLAELAASANQSNLTDLGDFRTLRPSLRNYDFNASFATRLAPWLTSNATLRLSRNDNRGLLGLASGLFSLGPDNPSSPFSRTVALAFLNESDPLEYRTRRDSGEGNLTLNATFGRWRANFNARHSEATFTTSTNVPNAGGVMPLAADFDPFGADLGDMIAIRTDRAKSRTKNTSAQLTLTGSPVDLPAGPLEATLEGRLGWSSTDSRSNFGGLHATRSVHRNDQSLRGAIEVPLASREGFLAEIGQLDATAEYSLIHFSDAGTTDRYGFGLTWEPRPPLRLRGAFEHTKAPAPIELLGDPVVVTPDVRMFDPLTGDTTDVAQITGGNPLLLPQTTRARRASAILRLLPKLGLQLNGEYTDIDERNFVSGLPTASAAIMLAFPDRFIRNSDGVLTQVDLRPVNFESHRQSRFRYGLSLNAPLGGGARPSFAAVTDSDDDAPDPDPAAAAKAAIRNPPTRFQLTVNHSIALKDEIRIRPGLDPVNLLKGGAIGIAGGRGRDQIDATAALTSGGTGVRAGLLWRGSNLLETRFGDTTGFVRFSPILTVNVRAFADMRRLFPNSDWSRSARLSLNVLNLTNDRQRVRDSFGNTPLQYQPGYRDPLGRTIELEIRKVF